MENKSENIIINTFLDIEIFVDLFDELLYQKVARLLNEKVMFVFTTQMVKMIQKDNYLLIRNVCC